MNLEGIMLNEKKSQTQRDKFCMVNLYMEYFLKITETELGSGCEGLLSCRILVKMYKLSIIR